MTYDMASPPKHQAALYRSARVQWLSCEESVNEHVKKGIPLNKLVLGIPFYGHGSGKQGEIPGFIDYKDIIKLIDNGTYKRKWDNTAKAPWLADAYDQLACTYDDTESIVEKCKFICKKEMLGAMYWDYAGDDDNGTLRNAVYSGIFNKVQE